MVYIRLVGWLVSQDEAVKISTHDSGFEPVPLKVGLFCATAGSSDPLKIESGGVMVFAR
jgi:hypothetical protein